jgi:hypothetical protein
MVWEGAGAGEHLLVARATDNRGGMTKCEPVRITVIDEHPLPRVLVIAADPIAAEGGPNTNTDPAGPNTATFMVHRTERNDLPLDVFYQLGGSAENGGDYVGLSGIVTIPAGEWCAPVVIDPIDDNLVEGLETVVIELEPVACPAIWPPSPGCYELGELKRAIAFIRDNDLNANQRPKIAITHPFDGETFEAPANVAIRAIAKDPDGWVGLVEFYNGREKIGEVALNFIQEPDPGQEQVFEFVWENAPLGAHVLAAVATDDQGARSVSDPVAIKVVRPDGPPVVTIHTRDALAREGGPNNEPNPARFRVKRSGDTGQSLTVYYAIGGSATNGEDYQELSGVVTIPPGRRSAPIIVQPIDDNLEERIETVVLKLVEPVSLANASIAAELPYVIGRPGRAAAYIVDNDHPRPNCVELPNGMVSLCLEGRDGVSYGIETTTDFDVWHRIDTNTAWDGRVDFVDTEAEGQGRRFYRIVEAVDALRAEEEME